MASCVSKFSIVLVFLFFPLDLLSQKRFNQFKDRERHGYWIDHWDNDTLHIANTGRYKKGVPKGTWKYYSRSGVLEKKERIIGNTLYTRFYYPGGQTWKKGKAKAFYKDTIHYFYSGKWKTYDENGQLMKIQVYRKGRNVFEKELVTEARSGSNDSLLLEIRKLNRRFEECSTALREAEEKFSKGSPEYNREIKKLNEQAAAVYEEIDRIILKFGYPGKTLVGADHALVFSMISSGSPAIKDRYYQVMIDAADKGELDWTDVAFFVDKVLVGRKQPQKFGTQFRIISDVKIYYPIQDPARLNERRKKAGLHPLDISVIDDSVPY